jgi:hypothetical protein
MHSVEPKFDLENIGFEDINKEVRKFVSPEIESHKIESSEFRKQFLIDPLEELQPPQTAWGLRGFINDEVAILGTLGNFSLIIGKAKAKKSFFVNIAVSCALSKDEILNRFVGNLPANKNQVIYFDTEQGKYHVQLAVKRICRQLGEPSPQNLRTYHLRSLEPAKRMQFIEDEIYSNDKIGFVVIDGIKDLITSINDEAEATMVTSKLLKWTEERNIHIITVLHQNKGDNNARGHIGTELQNKAETVLSITKAESNPDVSTMEAVACRNRDPETFSFEINEDGLPVEVLNFEPSIKKERKTGFTELEDYKKYGLLTEVFSHGKEFKYASLQSQIKIAYQKQLGSNLSNNKIVDLITYCKNSNWLNQSGVGQPYTLLEYKPAETPL